MANWILLRMRFYKPLFLVTQKKNHSFINEKWKISVKVLQNSPDENETQKIDTTTTNVRRNRVNWLIGLRIMWSRVETSLRMPRNKFIKLPCMRKKRERSEKIIAKYFSSLISFYQPNQSFRTFITIFLLPHIVSACIHK